MKQRTKQVLDYIERFGQGIGLLLIFIVSMWDIMARGWWRGFWHGGVQWKGITVIWVGVVLILIGKGTISKFATSIYDYVLDQLTRPKR